MKETLLEMVQDMLAAIEAENVTDVGDTEEADMCVRIANRAFATIATHKRWRHFRTFDRLDTTANVNEMRTKNGVYAIDPYNIYYDGQRVEYVDPKEFMHRTIARNTSDSTITEVNDIKIINNANPTFFTTDDDEILRFDAVPNINDGLAGSDTRCLVWKMPTQRLSAAEEIFDLPAVVFPALKDLCMSIAMNELKMDAGVSADYKRDYKTKMARLARNARLVDVPNDIRANIIARSSNYRPRTLKVIDNN